MLVVRDVQHFRSNLAKNIAETVHHFQTFGRIIGSILGEVPQMCGNQTKCLMICRIMAWNFINLIMQGYFACQLSFRKFEY